MKGCRRAVLVLVLVVDILLVALLWRSSVGPHARVHDRVGLIPAADERRYNLYLEQVRRRSGLLSETMGEVGIRVERQWLPQLVAVLDRNGRVVWRAEGVTEWEGVPAAARSAAEDT